MGKTKVYIMIGFTTKLKQKIKYPSAFVSALLYQPYRSSAEYD